MRHLSWHNLGAGAFFWLAAFSLRPGVQLDQLIFCCFHIHTSWWKALIFVGSTGLPGYLLRTRVCYCRSWNLPTKNDIFHSSLQADFSYQFFKDFDQLLPTASWGCSMTGENDTAFQKQYSFRSVVAKEWSSVDYLATGAASGNLVVFSTQDKGPVNRRDVVNNAHILGAPDRRGGFLAFLNGQWTYYI